MSNNIRNIVRRPIPPPPANFVSVDELPNFYNRRIPTTIPIPTTIAIPTPTPTITPILSQENRNMAEIMNNATISRPANFVSVDDLPDLQPRSLHYFQWPYFSSNNSIPTTIPIRNGPILSMNKNKLNVNVISLQPFEDDEIVDVVYTPDEVAKLNRSESVNITSAMIYKPEHLQGWINSGKTTNPQTRQPIALRERRKLKLTSANNKAKVNQTKNNKSKNNQSKGNPPKKGFRFSTKFPFFKTRKNRRTHRK